MKLIDNLECGLDDCEEYSYIIFIKTDHSNTVKGEKLKLYNKNGIFGYDLLDGQHTGNVYDYELVILLKEGEEIPELFKAIYLEEKC